MLIFILCALPLACGIACLILDDIYDLDEIGWVLICIGSVALSVCVLAMAVNGITAPINQAQWYVQYSNLCIRTEQAADDDNDTTGELKDDVDEWNEKYLNYKYSKQSLWVNWFHPIDISEFSTLTLHNRR